MKIKKNKIKTAAITSILKKASMSRMKLAKYALENTKFYKELYTGILKKYKRINNIPFYKLPFVRKTNINNTQPFDLLSSREKNKVCIYGETTGSTGSPTPSFYTKKEFNGSYKLTKITPYSSLIKQVAKKNRKAVCGLACGFTIAGLSFHNILKKLGFLTVNVDSRTTIAPPYRVANLIRRFKPSVIAASETDFLAYMKIIKEEYGNEYDNVVNELKILISTAELCSENRSHMIEKVFDIIHIDNYSCVEGFFSLPCPCGEKHILPAYYTEVLSENLRESGEFGNGRFVFTNLLRKSTPFVRYLLDDYVTIYKSSCEYGFKKSIQPHGRYELTVKINNKRYGTRHFENLLFENNLFGEYMVQIDADRIMLSVEDYENTKIYERRIIEKFEKEFLIKTELEIISYGTLRNYYEIRQTKPILRLQDNRNISTQKIPQYL